MGEGVSRRGDLLPHHSMHTGPMQKGPAGEGVRYLPNVLATGERVHLGQQPDAPVDIVSQMRMCRLPQRTLGGWPQRPWRIRV